MKIINQEEFDLEFGVSEQQKNFLLDSIQPNAFLDIRDVYLQGATAVSPG